VNAPRLRAALTSLHHERRRASSPLTREAERTIGRRMAKRWGLGTATIAAVGAVVALSWIGGVPASNGNDAPAAATMTAPTPPPAEPQAIPAVVHIPLDGGPQYDNQWGELECGDPAPASLTAAPQQRLSLDLTWSGVGDIATSSLRWDAPADQPRTRSEPVASVTATELFAVQEGVVVGTIIAEDATWGWQLAGRTRTITGHANLNKDAFYCIGLDSSGGFYTYGAKQLDPGSYEVLAITRVFATPESVALTQALALTNLGTVDETLKQAGVDYSPGSPGCQTLWYHRATVRSCLPDVTPTATLDEETATVRMLYDASALPQEFDVTLVSAPLTMVVE